GYDSGHKNIELLRLRNFTVGKKLEDEEVIGSKGLARVAELISCMVPFITYLNSIVMPDDPVESGEEADTSNETAQED
ncbi:hypothetical protein B0A49_07763, partial [Cryomyces minteri]